MKTDNLSITLQILSLIAEIDEFKGAWRALGQVQKWTPVNIVFNK